MSEPDQPTPPEDAQPAREKRPTRFGKRTMLLALAAIVIVAAVVITTVRLAPNDAGVAAAKAGAPRPPAAQQPSAAHTPNTPPPPPPKEGPRFAGWVYEVAQWLDIPARAMSAYAGATVTLNQEQPQCHLSWVTLAGIGKTTTDHGRVNGSQLGGDGTPSEPIGTVELRDVTGTVVSDRRASGPMQLTPTLWKKWQRSASGHKPDQQNIDDAALTTGRALCAGGRDLAKGEPWWAGVRSLQKAPLFLHRVLATANVYGTVATNPRPPNRAALKAVNFAIDNIGLPYVWGGNGPESGGTGFDCSGLTTAAYGQSNIDLPRMAHWQYQHVPLIPASEEPRLGDLVFFGNPDTKIHHVGIYIGNKQMIDAPTFGQAVQVHAYRKLGDDYAGAGRPAQ